MADVAPAVSQERVAASDTVYDAILMALYVPTLRTYLSR